MSFECPLFVLALHLQLAIDDRTQEDIGDQLIKLGHKVSGVKLANFKTNRIDLQPKKLTLKGRTGWDSKLQGKIIKRTNTLNKEQQDGIQHQGHFLASGAPAESAAPITQTCNAVLFKCLRCTKYETCGHKTFAADDLDKHHKCQECCESTRIRDWTCPCQLPWHVSRSP